MPNYSANVMESPPSRENKGNLLGNNPLFFQSKLALFSVRFQFREAGKGRHLSAFRMLFDVIKDFALAPGIGIKLKGQAFGQYFSQIDDAVFNDINIFLSRRLPGARRQEITLNGKLEIGRE